MAKYPGFFTIKEVCKAELEELNEILAKSNVSKEDKEKIRDMIIEPYFQLSEANASGRVLENIISENNIIVTIQDYEKRLIEEKKKFPFDLEEE